jgi:hypothetical protein
MRQRPAASISKPIPLAVDTQYLGDYIEREYFIGMFIENPLQGNLLASCGVARLHEFPSAQSASATPCLIGGGSIV